MMGTALTGIYNISKIWPASTPKPISYPTSQVN